MNMSVELKKIFDEYVDKGGCVMDIIPKIEALYNPKLTFKIDKIVTERSIVGNTTVTATCIETNKTFTVYMTNGEFSNKEVVRQKFIDTHKMIFSDKPEPIKEGDVI